MFEAIKKIKNAKWEQFGPLSAGGPYRGRGWLHKYKPALRHLIYKCVMSLRLGTTGYWL